MVSTLWSVYIVKTKLGTLYTGITTDVAQRISDHEKQGKKCAKYLKGKAPLELVYQRIIGTKSEALKIESQIKKMCKRDKESLINGG